MENNKFNKLIKIVESKMKLQLSDEQLQVLKYGYQSPVLLNSCAGAGKTTLLIISIIMQMLDGVEPSNILAITFSKEAQLDMGKKFELALHKLGVQPQSRPTFSTFDALFLKLLRKIKPDLKVLASGYNQNQIRYAELNALQTHHPVLSDNELLTRIESFKDQLINHQYSYDGYNLKLMQLNEDNLAQLADEMHVKHSKEFYTNYIHVIKAYLDAKNNRELVDFNDMKTQLLQSLGNANHRQIILDAMSHYQIAFIDEFQDINSIQWELMNQLLPTQAKNRLAMIGDDDQSIYSFRGSNPNIILNLHENIKDLKTFNLTINYRTAGNVLDHVAPMIQNNQYRLSKPLNVFKGNQKQGQLLKFIGNENKYGRNMLLDNLVTKLDNPDIMNKDIVVLCRNNIDVALASDYLADHHHFLNVNRKSNIIQYDKDYRSFLEIMESLVFDHFKAFYNNANKIGFNPYVKHINDVLKTNNLKSVDSLSEYLKLANQYDNKNLHESNFQEQTWIDCDHTAQYLLNRIHDQDIINSSLSNGEVLFNALARLTSKYHAYMDEKRYIDISHYNEIFKYLNQKLKNVDNMKNWFRNETDKQEKLETMVQNSQNNKQNKLNQNDIFQPASFMTIHSAKGLEFDYVYVYNPRTNGVTLAEIKLNQTFKPNMSKSEFIEMLLNDSCNKFKHQTDYKWIYDFSLTFKKAMKHAKRKHKQKQLTDTLTGRIQKTYNEELEKEFDNDYQLIISKSHDVEDERRLLYVALTRSIKNAYYSEDLLDLQNQTTPLLNELTTPINNQLLTNDNDKVISINEEYANKDYNQSDELSFKQMLNQY